MVKRSYHLRLRNRWKIELLLRTSFSMWEKGQDRKLKRLITNSSIFIGVSVQLISTFFKEFNLRYKIKWYKTNLVLLTRKIPALIQYSITELESRCQVSKEFILLRCLLAIK